MQIERRHFHLEVRADVAGRKLVGVAARYGVEADIGPFFEVIRPGAFRASLAGQDDIAAYTDHNPERLLGRRSSGTLKLAEDARGLLFEIDVPDTSTGRDVLELARRGDCSGCSFGFTDPVDEWRDRQHRELRSVRLIEISIITGGAPAYPQTNVSARSQPSRGDHTRLSPVARRRYLASL